MRIYARSNHTGIHLTKLVCTVSRMRGTVSLKWLLALLVMTMSLNVAAEGKRWSEERINQWYSQQPWLVGANYVPRNAINQLEMWQADTFSPDIIDQELGWAASIGMNTMRVFLHDLAWKQDPDTFLNRIDQYLAISDKHGISTMLVFFDDVWDPIPKIGKQKQPTPHVHNSGWVQSPGKAILGNPLRHDDLEPYVKSVMTRFKSDKRVLAWDLYNEPGNMIGNSYGRNGLDIELKVKAPYSLMLLGKVFEWAREVDPVQPITATAWHAVAGKRQLFVDDKMEYRGEAALHPNNRFVLAHSDFISWHNYDHVESFKAETRGLQTEFNRPLMLTEYLARDAKRAKGTNSFKHFLSAGKEYKVAMYNWGLVDGKSQTKYPWNTWDVKFESPPQIWHHDIFHKDGRPYDENETTLIKGIIKD